MTGAELKKIQDNFSENSPIDLDVKYINVISGDTDIIYALVKGSQNVKEVQNYINQIQSHYPKVTFVVKVLGE